MKKIFTVLALLLAFSLLYSCNKNNTDTDTDESSQSDIQSDVQNTEDTQNRINQSTLPPLDDGDKDDTDFPTGGDGYQTGNSNFFKPESGNGNNGSSLAVGEDSGFGGEIERAD